jgi:hypothetical protein
MTGRFVSFCSTVFLLAGAVSAQAQGQGPQSWGNPGSQPYGVQGPAWYSPQETQGPTTGWRPWTPPYQPGPANRSWDNVSGNPDNGWGYENTPLDDFLGDVARNSYFRLEYLAYGLKNPSNRLLGSAVLSQADPSVPFQVTDTGGQLAGEARVATTGDLQYPDGSGIRGTIGIPLVGGTVEANVFYFDQLQDGSFIDRLGDQLQNQTLNPLQIPQFIATSTLTTGQVGNNLLLYDDSFTTRTSADLWGSEINYVFDAYLPEPMFQLRPLIGFRHLDLREELNQIGVFDQQDLLVTPLVSRISSYSENTIYAPQIGLRGELVSRWLTLGIEPKLAAGINIYETSVVTQALRSAGDPSIRTTASGEEFSVVGELNLYAKFHIRQNFAITVGYQATFMDQVTRAHTAILYNDNGANADPAIVTNPSLEQFDFGGINISGELKF